MKASEDAPASEGSEFNAVLWLASCVQRRVLSLEPSGSLVKTCDCQNKRASLSLPALDTYSFSFPIPTTASLARHCHFCMISSNVFRTVCGPRGKNDSTLASCSAQSRS